MSFKMMFILVFAIGLGLGVRAEEFATELHGASRYFPVQIGSPPQEMYVTYSLETSQTVFVDIDCGQQPHCPRYCQDEHFKKMYCTPICRAEISKSTCNQGLKPPITPKYTGYHFWPQNSSSFQLVNKDDWYSNTVYFGQQFGKHFTDTLTFPSDGDYTANLTIQNVEMIDGLLLEDYFFDWSGGVVGLAPGDGNIVTQLYAQNLIPMPTALLVIGHVGYTGVLGFGIDVDGFDVCDQHYIQRPTMNSNYWVFELEDFELNGLSYGKKTKALLSDNDNWIYLLSKFMRRLVDLKVISIYDGPEVDNHAYIFPCDQLFELTLTVDGQNLTVSKSALTWKPIGNNTCLSFLGPLEHPHYLTNVDMVEIEELVVYLEEDRKPEFPEDAATQMVQLAYSNCFVKDNEERAIS